MADSKKDSKKHGGDSAAGAAKPTETGKGKEKDVPADDLVRWCTTATPRVTVTWPERERDRRECLR